MEHIKELEEVIKKHLPELAAKEMKEFIEQANKDKASLKGLEALYERTLKEKNEADKDNYALRSSKQAIEQQGVANEAKAVELDKKERNQKIDALVMQLAVEQRSKNDIFNLVSLLVKNPRAIEMFNSNENVYNNKQTFYDVNDGRNREQLIESSRNVVGTKEFKEEKDE